MSQCKGYICGTCTPDLTVFAMSREVVRVAEPVRCRPTVAASMATHLNAGSSPGSPPVEGVILSTSSSGRHLDKRGGLEGAG